MGCIMMWIFCWLFPKIILKNRICIMNNYPRDDYKIFNENLQLVPP